MKDSELKSKNLKEAIKEYYEWHGETNAVPVSIARHKNGGFDLVLIHFNDEDGNEMSSLVVCEHWKDGHYDVFEVFDSEREEETQMVQSFINSDEFV